jgi:hypothetical protein
MGPNDHGNACDDQGRLDVTNGGNVAVRGDAIQVNDLDAPHYRADRRRGHVAKLR